MPRIIKTENHEFTYPEICPHCLQVGDFDSTSSYLDPGQDIEFDRELFCRLICPNPHCGRPVWVHYTFGEDGKQTTMSVYPPRKPNQVPSSITDISPDFWIIFQEAFAAKSIGLMQICGPGFRKAFEFFVKDYAKYKAGSDVEKRATIEHSPSSKVLQDCIADTFIQSLAKLTLWLGNDETHYKRKWAQLDIDDLVELIRLTVHWIDDELKSTEYIDKMTKGQDGG